MSNKQISVSSQLIEEEIIEKSDSFNYDTKDYTIDYLVSRFKPRIQSKQTETSLSTEEDSISFIVPDYQRNFIWSNKDKSLFIESILLGFPIPFLFFCQRKDGDVEIVDGAQRMSTLHEFFANAFKLENLTKLTHSNGLYFSDLPSSIRKTIKNKTLRIIVLEGKTSLKFRKDLFSRVNRAGKRITDAEYRRGSFPGKFTDFIENCSNESIFKKICPLTDSKVNRYTREELVLRYFALLNEYHLFKHDVGPFLDSYLQRQNDSHFDADEVKLEFMEMCRFVESHFPNGFAKITKNGKGKNVPNVRFEAIAIGVGLALRENPALIVNNLDWLKSEDFIQITTSGSSNNQGKLKKRVEYVRDKLLGKS